jgi:hypothetical protein
MKYSKLKKLIKKSLTEVIEKDRYDRLIKEEPNTFQEMMFSEPNEDVSLKFRKLVIKLLKLRDDLNIHINENRITINSELSRLKNSKYQNDDYMSIEIIKETGFLFSYNNKRLAYRDKTIYDEILSEMKNIFEKVNKENFNEIYQTILVDTGLSREANLEDLLD